MRLFILQKALDWDWLFTQKSDLGIIFCLYFCFHIPELNMTWNISYFKKLNSTLTVFISSFPCLFYHFMWCSLCAHSALFSLSLSLSLHSFSTVRWAHALCHKAELCCCLDYIALSFSQAAGNWGIVVLAVPRSGLSTWQLLASYKQGNQYFRTVAVPSVYNNTIPWHLACLQPMSDNQNSIWHTFSSQIWPSPPLLPIISDSSLISLNFC